MKKLLFLIITLQISLLGYNYNELLLKAQASVFPKLILLDKDISKKVYKNSINLCIVFHESDYLISQKIKNSMEKNFKGKLDRYKLNIVLKRFDEIGSNDNVYAYYILQGNDESIKKVCTIAQQRKIITFSYDIKSFEDGALISLVIYNRSFIYLNKRLIRSYDINFINSFYQVVKFTNE
jgi:hypothetical protein